MKSSATKFLILIVFGALAQSCANSGSGTVQDADTLGRRPSAEEGSNSAFNQALERAGLKVYFANLHSHHFMQYTPSRKSGESEEFLGPGACHVSENFLEDDGRPCRNDESGTNSYVTPPSAASGKIDRLDYFKMACQYAKEKGGLDILYITPHSKNGESSETSTFPKSFAERQRLLAEINQGMGSSFYCGLGQEVSSISSGNHVGVIGHFPASATEVQPFLFPAGAFDIFYPQVKSRAAAGESVILQFNHPDVHRNLWWKPVAGIPKKARKKILNEYGIDDFAPVGCMIKGAKVAGCQGEAPEIISAGLLKQTYDHIRDAAGDAFKQIEIVSPGGATTNPGTSFRKVHQRANTASPASATGSGDGGAPDNEGSGFATQGLYNFVYYLAMGFKLSPTADQDNHHANWGSATASRTGILSASLKEGEIVDSLQKRRTFASEDKNARIIFYAETPSSDKPIIPLVQLMGSEFETSEDQQSLFIGYQDPDVQDRRATIRIYYYRQSDNLDFGYFADQKNVFRTIEFQNGNAVLPVGPTQGFNETQMERDTLPISSGEVLKVRIPLEKGLQWAFVEVTQSNDLDKLWSAPIWIKKR